ncbi:MAG: hypothetical protein NTU54_02270 [Candidatus Omnitrophica bacterium]|nr:hypothetical protein [Candidatus Omnitrophota bacterium]
MKNLKVVLIAFLVGITAVCVFEYLTLLREKMMLLDSLNKTKNELGLLQQERLNLLQGLEKEKEQENQLEGLKVLYKNNLRATRRKVAKLRAEQKLSEDLSGHVNILKLENSVLRRRYARLNQKLDQLEQRNQDFQQKFNSLSELKKAIQALRRKERKVEEGRKVEEVMVQESPTRKIIKGNKGFLVKDGKPTLPLKINIEVTPDTKLP